MNWVFFMLKDGAKLKINNNNNKKLKGDTSKCFFFFFWRGRVAKK